uniref:CAP domain-containing protein (inferred by orthology to a zebrafish protein) n=1 Tax=Strongyloides venezuelensis TaxID=75913 RepID=A0A0K0EUT8_STRVS
MSYYSAVSVIVTKLYDENRKYKYLLNKPQTGTQMFTQLIWEIAASISVGVARSGDRDDSDKKNSVKRRISSRRRSSSSSGKIKINNHNKTSIRRSSSCNRYSGFNIRSYLSGNKYSNDIYWSIWGVCDYRCFCQNNFKLFLKSYGVSVSVVYNPLSSLIVTEWHDQRYYYSYTFGYGSYYTSKFTQLVWKNTKFVGVGAATNGSHTFLAVFYFPTGNIPGKYKKMSSDRILNYYGR